MDLGDPSSQFAREFKEIVRGVMEELGKPNLADYFSLLRKMDPQGIRKRMSVRFRKMVGMFNTIIEQRLQVNSSSTSDQGNHVLDELLRLNQEKTENIEPFNIPCLLQDLFIAGTDTTSSTLEWAMAELLRNPEKLKKAQSELDEIIGKGNALEEADITRLPYLQAIVKEIFRLHPVLPLLVPKKVDSDLKLFGFTVPKNAQVLVNVWKIGRDSDLWENPNSFQPERFLGSKIDVKGRDFELIPFGAGRRMCPGLALANIMIHLMLGSLIHEFCWELVGGVSQENMDMEERYGLTLEKAHPLRVIPTCI